MYVVKETKCYPNSFQVYNKNARFNNATCNFFRNKEEAQTVADKRNTKRSK